MCYGEPAVAHEHDENLLKKSERADYFAGDAGAPNFRFVGDIDGPRTAVHSPSRAAFISAEPLKAVLTVEIKADDIQFIQAVHKGMILDAAVLTGQFEQNSQNGILLVSVTNAEMESAGGAMFTVSLETCSEDVQPIPAQQITLQGGETSTLRFSVKVESTLLGKGKRTIAYAQSHRRGKR